MLYSNIRKYVTTARSSENAILAEYVYKTIRLLPISIERWLKIDLSGMTVRSYDFLPDESGNPSFIPAAIRRKPEYKIPCILPCKASEYQDENDYIRNYVELKKIQK